MKVVATLNDVGAMLRKRGLDPNGEVQKRLTLDVYRLSEPYVPFQQGTLAHGPANVVADDYIIYNTPYAHYQWYGEIMGPNVPLEDGGFFSPVAPKRYTGREIEYNGAPRRGKEWTKRMWKDKKNVIINDIANAAGGKPEP